MKKTFILFFIAFASVAVFGQSPEKMSYQAVLRDNNGSLLQNRAVSVRISILQASANGTPVFIETHSPTTNVNGLITLEIGNGAIVSGTFTGIDWSAGPYFIKVEADISGGTNYSVTGVSQMLSVPYALYAKTAENVLNLKIGDNYGGGIVFYVYDNGRHGLIAASSDVSTGIRWYSGGGVPGSYSATLAKADGVGAGRINTPIIIGAEGVGDGQLYAARVCNEYFIPSGLTYGDWYLPSKFELNLLFLQKNIVGGFAEDSYWSSTEEGNPFAWSQNFAGGLQSTSIKNSIYRVRAIRAF